MGMSNFFCVKTMQRILSMVVCFTLFVTLTLIFPTGANAVSESSEKYIIDLTLCKSLPKVHTDSTYLPYDSTPYAGDLRYITLTDTTAAITSSMTDYLPWVMAGYASAIYNSVTTEAVAQKVLRNNQPYGCELGTGKVGQWVSIKFNVPTAGTYYPVLKYGRTTVGCTGKVYLAPWSDDNSTWRNSSNLIGTVNYYTSVVWANDSIHVGLTTELNAVNITAPGDYVLTFETYQATVNKWEMHPQTFTLYETPPSSLDSVSVSLSNTSILTTGTSQASVTGTRADGNTADLSGASITYSSSAPEIASVDSNSGLITAHSVGSTQITASITLNGVTREGTVPLNVLTLQSIQLKDKMMLVGQHSQAIISGTLSDGSAVTDFSSYEINYSSSNTEIVSIDTQSGEITANAIGDTTITANIIVDGQVKSATANISVLEIAQPVEVDFSKTVTAKADNGYYAITSSPGYTVNENESQRNDRREYNLNGFNALHVDVRGGGYWPASTNMNPRFTIKVNVPIPSNYTMYLQGALWYFGCIASVYIDDKYMGDYSFYNGDTTHTDARTLGDMKRLNSIFLTEGEHNISFRSRSSDVSYPALLLYKLSLNPINSESVLTNIESDIPEKLAIGEIFKTNIQAMMSDNAPYHFGLTGAGISDAENYISAINSDQSVAEMSSLESVKIGSGDTATATIVPKIAGQTTVTVTAKVHGITLTHDYPIEITNEQLSQVQVHISDEEVFAGNTVHITSVNILDSGRVANNDGILTIYESENPEIATIDGDKLVTTGAGIARIRVTSTLNGVTVSSNLDVNILPEGMTAIKVTAGGCNYLKIDDTEGTPLWVKVFSNLGNELDTTNAAIIYEALTPDLATINEKGIVFPIAMGDAQFKVTVTISGRTGSVTAAFPIIKGKTEPTIYTMQKRANIRTNGEKYAWAKSQIKSYTDKADEYVDRADELWNMVVSEGLPRGITVGQQNDPEAYTCRYPDCKANLLAKYGNYPWIVNPLIDPWKIQCPECKNKFPSNDFASYYKLGLNEYGEFDPKLARERNDALVASGQPGFLKNILYPEMGEGWGVDDGTGYLTGKIYPNNVPERHTYIAYYLHWGLWYNNSGNPGILQNAVSTLAYAYAYTGEAKYGRTGAILLDRIADFYPGFNLLQWNSIVLNSHGGSGRGKTIGCIWECNTSNTYALAYDMLYPAFDDPYVIDFLKNKSAKYKMTHSKQTAAQIRNNVEDGILRTIYSGVKDGSITGNFGMPQKAIATAAVALDSMPETGEWLDWMMHDGVAYSNPCTGGNVADQLVDVIDRDGMGNEGSGYNVGWLTNLFGVADVLEGYKTYQKADLYQNSKFIKMLTAFLPLTLCSYYSPQIGDSGSTAGSGLWMTTDIAKRGFRHIGDPKFAQTAYLLNNNSVNDLHESITEDNPEQIQQDIKNVIDVNGTINLKSEMMTGFGFAVLHGGAKYSSTGVDANYDRQRDFWIYFGKNSGHGHKDTLNLGIDSYGLNMAPDLGYPEITGTQPNRLQWVSATLSHNTVMVDLANQKTINYHGMPLHFDESGKVKVMDINAPEAYDATDIYRRTLVMVEASDDVSYGVDFFRVSGGNDHIYSFHSQSDEIYETQGLNLVRQSDENGNYIGTYAGADVPWGPDPNSPAEWNYVTQYPRGFTWLDKVSRDSNPGSSFAVDFKIKDFKNILPSAMNLHLRMTMINDVPMTEVATANGYPPNTAKNKNIDNLKYVLVRRSGQNLDTLFTTIYEPYKDNRYIQSIESVSTETVNGSQGAKNTIKAVKVTHTSGRIDYVVYATNNTVTYKIDNVFNFRGFVGVYTIINGEPVYSYVNDGDIIGNQISGMAAVTGTVTDFTKELQKDNQITVLPDQTISADELSGKYIYINNDGVENGVYKIESAAPADGGKVTLNIGYVSPIRSYIDSSNLNGSYVYNISAGQSFRIPLSNVTDNSPVFTPIGEKYVDANSEIRFKVSATSPINRTLTYRAVALPQGASFDPATREFMWVPDSAQQGENHVSIEASDGYLSATEHFVIKVLGGTNNKTYTVSFDVDGAISTQEVEHSAQAIRPSDPEKEGYRFTGWYLDSNFYDFSSSVTRDITLTAVFEPMITITGVRYGNGDVNIDFDIISANGKGYKVYISETGEAGSFVEYENVNYNSKGAHIKKIGNGKHYVFIEYSKGSMVMRSGIVTITPGA